MTFWTRSTQAKKTMHLRCDGNSVQDAEWEAAAQRYMRFVEGIEDGNTLLLELGVGWNTPVLSLLRTAGREQENKAYQTKRRISGFVSEHTARRRCA